MLSSAIRLIERARAVVVLTALLLTATAPAPAQDFQSLFDAAQTARSAGAFAEAERLYRQALDISPDNAEVEALLALTLAFRGRLEEARETIAAAHRRNPDDRFVRITHARIQSFAGKYDDALALLNPELESRPPDLQAMLLAGRIHYFQGEHARAGRLFRQVLERDPNSSEALLGVADVAIANGDADRAEAALARARSAGAASNEIAVREGRLAALQQAGRAQWRLTLGAEYSRLQRIDLDDWKEAFAYIERAKTGEPTFLLFLHAAERFSKRDRFIEGTVRFDAGNHVKPRLSAGLGPGADFLPSRRVRAGLSARLYAADAALAAGVADIEARRSYYREGTVEDLLLRYDQYVAGDALILSPGLSTTWAADGTRTVGWSIRAVVTPAPGLRLGAFYADAPETSEGVTADTVARGGFVSLDVDDRHTLRLDGGVEDRQDSYRRISAAVSVTRRF